MADDKRNSKQQEEDSRLSELKSFLANLSNGPTFDEEAEDQVQTYLADSSIDNPDYARVKKKLGAQHEVFTEIRRLTRIYLKNYIYRLELIDELGEFIEYVETLTGKSVQQVLEQDSPLAWQIREKTAQIEKLTSTVIKYKTSLHAERVHLYEKLKQL